MNTWIWGPPKWKFLHTLSFSPDAHAHAGVVCDFLNTLSNVLPCKYCRESYAKCVKQLERTTGLSLHETIATRQLSRWMYNLHDKINEKLDKQMAVDAAKQSGININVKQQDALCRKRQITFECLTKRFIIRPVSFCADDVWEFLLIFAYNMDLTYNKAGLEMRDQWRLFFRLVPQVAALAGATTPLVAALALVPRVHNVTFFHAVVQAQAQYQGKTFTVHMVTEAQQIYSYARATMCAHGSCK